MNTRKISGTCVRYVIGSIMLVPVVITMVIGYTSEKIEAGARYVMAKLGDFAGFLNRNLTAWESNTPEGTMERLRTVGIKEKND